MKIVKIPKREEGQGLVEYALILVLVAIVVIIILTQIGTLIVLAFAGIIGSFTGQQTTGTGNEGIVVGGGSGGSSGSGCVIPSGTQISVVLTDDGSIITDNTINTVNFSYANGTGAIPNQTVVVGSSGVGTYTMSGNLSSSCPLQLTVSGW